MANVDVKHGPAYAIGLALPWAIVLWLVIAIVVLVLV